MVWFFQRPTGVIHLENANTYVQIVDALDGSVCMRREGTQYVRVYRCISNCAVEFNDKTGLYG